MPRKPLAIGTHGEVNVRERTRTIDGQTVTRHGAYCLYRDADGVTRKVEKWGATPYKAKALLQEALRDRVLPSTGGDLTAGSLFADLAAVYLARVEGHRRGTSSDTYRSHLRNHILPALGKLRIRECGTARLQDFMDALAGRAEPLAANTRRTIKSVLQGVMHEAVRRGILTHNPARELERIEGKATAAARAYSAEQLLDFLAKVDADRNAKRSDLPDLIRFLFGTGCRIGEVLAVRWRDLNLSDRPVQVDGEVIPPRSVWINGGLIYVNGKGLYRNEGKTFAANRKIELPLFLHHLLLTRESITEDPNEPVFPSGALTWRHSRNVQKAVRALRKRVGYPDFTTHVGRKTVATVLSLAGHDARQIADQLGQASIVVTQDVYIQRGLANPAAAAAIHAAHQPPGNAGRVATDSCRLRAPTVPKK